MQLNPTTTKKGKKGFTLIEITLVLALILGLIAILIVSIRSYLMHADRTRCILTITDTQKAVRSEANAYELNIGAPFPTSRLVPAYFATLPRCPSTNSNYQNLFSQVPAYGTLYFRCATIMTVNSGVRNHNPDPDNKW